MIYLLEREAGFATDGIGFPSILGCMAVVVRTNTGLYGFHNAGGSRENQFATRAGLFATYVTEHNRGPAECLHLYGVTFMQMQRGYTMGAERATWTVELTAFAEALGHTGPISGFDLTSTGWEGSAYVEYTAHATSCYVKVQRWSEGDKTVGANPWGPNQRSLIGRAPANIVTNVDSAAAHPIQTERLN
jgi:hypothetical protein